MSTRISVIIPVYNIRDFLPRCLDSVLQQTHGQLEVIAVDDGSSDGSAAVLDRYAEADARLKVIHKENGGVTSARLRGIQEATGDWIGFVDGDDEIEPDMYERLLRNAQNYDADISHCGYQMVFPDGRIHFFHNTGCLEVHDRFTAVRELLSGSRIEPGLWNKLFRKSLFGAMLSANSMDATIQINEDLLMNIILFSEASNAVFDDWCPYHYIVRGGSASRAKLNEHKIYDPIRVKDIIRKSVPTELKDDAQAAYLNCCITTYHVLITNGPGYRKDIRNIRHLLQDEKETFFQLGKKRALMARLILTLPVIYKPVYLFYCRFFQKRLYD